MSDTKRTTKEDDALFDAFAPMVNKLIDKNYESSKDKLALQLAPLIGSAIREQIKSHKDDVVDALYPVLGSMISRYVSKILEDTLNTINQQIQDGLSFKSLSRKLRAKMQGVSETELLLSENTNSNIRALLLIHKETGIVLAEANNPLTPLQEPEMVASMMSAIRSFVNDWIDKNESHKELGEIEFGGNKIILENSGYAYLAVIVDGATYTKTYEDIRNTLESVILENGEDIRNFNGDLSTFANIKIYKKISSLLSSASQEQKAAKKLHPLIYILPILLLAFISFKSYKHHLNSTITENIQNSISNNPQLSLYKIEVNTQNKEIILSGAVPFLYHKELIQSIVGKMLNKRTLNNQIKIISTLQDPMQISSNIAYLINGLNTNRAININYKYNYPFLKIYGSTWDELHKAQLIKEVKNIKNIKNVDFDIEVIPPKISTTIYFQKNSFRLSQESEYKLIALSKKLYSLDSTLKIVVNGYGDDSGTLKAKKYIVDKRIEKVSSFLSHKIKISQAIIEYSNYDVPKDINSTLTPEYARCVIIELQK